MKRSVSASLDLPAKGGCQLIRGEPLCVTRGTRRQSGIAPPAHASFANTLCVDDLRPPICPACGVTMVPSALSAAKTHSSDWICLECEENGESDTAELQTTFANTRAGW